MAVKKSTLNNNLGLASCIGSYISYKAGTYTNNVYLPYGTSIPVVYLGFKQPQGRTNPYQIQWRQTFRRTAPEAAKTGANWTGWTSVWKATTTVPASGGMAAIAADSTTDVDTWIRGNKSVDNSSLCSWAKSIKDFSIPAEYDATSIAIRVREFNYATQKHGAWAEDEIRFFRCSDVKDVNVIIAPDGGLYIAFNYSHTRAVTAEINSIQLLDREIFTGDTSMRVVVNQQARNNSTIPKSRANYTGGMIHVPSEQVSQFTSAGTNKYTVDFTLYTDLGAPTRVQETVQVSRATTTITQPVIEIESENDSGIVTIVMKRAKADEIYNDVGIRCTYSSTADGRPNVQPLSEIKTPENKAVGDTIYKATYALDMTGTTYSFYGYISNIYDISRWSDVITWKSPKTNFAYIDGMGDISHMHAILAGDMALTIDRTPTVIAEKPVGANNNMAAWYTGVSGRFTLQGLAVDGRYQNDSQSNAITLSNTIDALNKMSVTPGKYKVRMPDKRSYVGVLDAVSINQEDTFKADISIDFIEVVS